MAVDAGKVRQVRPQDFQCRFLLGARDGDAPLPVEEDALLQGGVVEGAATPQDALTLPLLGGRGLELLFVRLAHARLCHNYTSRLRRWRARCSRTAWTTALLMERSFATATCLMASATWRGKRMVMRVSSRSLLMVTLYHHQQWSARAKA